MRATAAIAFALVVTFAALPAHAQSATNERGAATKAFMDRIDDYVKFHNNVDKTVQSLRQTDDPDEIAKRERALGEALIKHRPAAKEGDFFIERYQPHLRRIIQDDFAKRPAADRRALLGELPKGVKIGVNVVYPSTLPLATFPANLLKVLPKLPDMLQYRMVGRDLILLDVRGNVIVDVMRDVFPIPGRS